MTSVSGKVSLEFWRLAHVLTGENVCRRTIVKDPKCITARCALVPESDCETRRHRTERARASEGGASRTDTVDTGRLYHGSHVDERHRHRYEVNPKKVPELSKTGLKFVGMDETGERMEIVELDSAAHPFYVAAQVCFSPCWLPCGCVPCWCVCGRHAARISICAQVNTFCYKSQLRPCSPQKMTCTCTHTRTHSSIQSSSRESCARHRSSWGCCKRRRVRCLL